MLTQILLDLISKAHHIIEVGFADHLSKYSVTFSASRNSVCSLELHVQCMLFLSTTMCRTSCAKFKADENKNVMKMVRYLWSSHVE